MSAGAKKLAQYPNTHRGDIEIEKRPKSEGKRQVSCDTKQPDVDKSTVARGVSARPSEMTASVTAKPPSIPIMIEAPTFPLDTCATMIWVNTVNTSPANGAVVIVHCPSTI